MTAPGIGAVVAAASVAAIEPPANFKRAAVALARKLAGMLHVMWKTGKNFDPNPRLAAG